MKERVWIVSNLKIGRDGSKKKEHIEQHEKYLDFLSDSLKRYKEGVNESRNVLIVAGDTFNNPNSLTVDSFHLAVKTFDRFSNEFDSVFVIPGDSETRNGTPFEIIASELSSLLNLVLFDEATAFEINNRQWCLVPSGHYSDDFDDGDTIIVYHDNLKHPPSKSLSFDGTGTSSVDFDSNVHSVIEPYQHDWKSSQVLKGVTVVENTKVTYLDNPNKTYIRAEIIDKKIEGLNPIKWVSENRKWIENSHLEIIVPEGYETSSYSKLLGVLSTVNLRELKMNESFNLSEDVDLSFEPTPLIESFVDNLSREGSIEKVSQIAKRLKLI